MAQRGAAIEVWAKDMEDGSKAVGLFNRSRKETSVTAQWSDLGLSGKQAVRELSGGRRSLAPLTHSSALWFPIMGLSW